MNRTFNYTGRKKILQNEVRINFDEETPRFDAKLTINNDEHDLPSDAEVYVEATAKQTKQRFSFGTVSKITPPDNLKLDKLDISGIPKFRILIVDATSELCKILAAGKGFKSEEYIRDTRDHLLPTIARDLGSLCWRVDFSNDEAVLILNKEIPNVIEKISQDPLYQALILPAALTLILNEYFLKKGAVDNRDEPGVEKWLTFINQMMREDKDPFEMSDEEIEEWLKHVISEFTNQHQFASKLIEAVNKGN